MGTSSLQEKIKQILLMIGRVRKTAKIIDLEEHLTNEFGAEINIKSHRVYCSTKRLI